MINEKRRENEEILAKHKKEICELKKSLEALDRDLAKANLDKEMGAKAESSTLVTMASSTAARDKNPVSYRRAPTATSGLQWSILAIGLATCFSDVTKCAPTDAS